MIPYITSNKPVGLEGKVKMGLINGMPVYRVDLFGGNRKAVAK
jgi:hypothetical protein